MAINVMLSLDLERGVGEEKRTKFNEYLHEQKWVKIPNVTTTWRCTFTEGVPKDAAIQTAKCDVANGAAYAGITNYQAVIHLGPEQPISFKN